MRRLIRILILLALLAGAQPVPAATAQQAADTVYVVQAGDTLSGIARRYGVTVADLAAANGLLNPNLIYVGQRVTIPAAQPTAQPTSQPTVQPTAQPAAAPAVRQVHVVQSGETLFRIALKYGTTVQALAQANEINNLALIYVGQQLVIPAGAAAVAPAQPSTPLRAPFTSVDIGPLPLEQGSVMVVTVRADRPVKLEGAFGTWTIPFVSVGDRYIGLVGVGASPVSGVTPGIHPVTLTATDESGRSTTLTTNVQINAGHFNSEYIDLPPDRQALLDPALVQAENEKLGVVFGNFTPTRYWSGLFNVPVDSYTRISSMFGTRRAYAGGPFSSYHEGTDFALPAGTPVYAPADGVIALAEPLTVRGNAVIIDHGWGVFSGYWHLSKIEVSVGQAVKAGDLIAYSGNTGLSTGAHLHWDMRIRGLNVDPLQFTQKTFP